MSTSTPERTHQSENQPEPIRGWKFTVGNKTPYWVDSRGRKRLESKAVLLQISCKNGQFSELEYVEAVALAGSATGATLDSQSDFESYYETSDHPYF